ncbi:unnamed protein product [Larinioides sclopetarius]|uniref:BTB domain-containing protein n=1 Tax=Larinioides sclopetarius TaxID=280406 RepID=A0AAV2B0L4_9ARAC
MSMQDLTEQSMVSPNECNSKSDEIIRKQKQQNSNDFLIVTKIPQKIYKFQWIIRQFSKISKNKALYSSDINVAAASCFQLKFIKNEDGFCLFHVWKTTLQSNELSTAEMQSYKVSRGVRLAIPSEFVSDDGTKEARNLKEFTIMLEYQVYATDSRGKELITWSVCFPDDTKSLSYKIGEYMNNTLKHFPDDSLIMNCNLKVILMPTTEEIPIAFKPSLESKSWKKLSMDLKALYQNSKDTDVILIVGTDKIHAHKVILTARSTVFKKIFHHDMKEVEQNSVTISDVNFSTLQRLVEFLYTGVIVDAQNKDMDLQQLFDLYYAADKYEVMDLREMVGNTLLGRAQTDNTCEILIWADRHNDKDLKSRIMNFIRQNFEVVFKTDAWESCTLHYPRLAIEVFSLCVKQTQTS